MTTAALRKKYPLTQGVNPWLVTLAVMLPTFMEVLDTAIASVALPHIAGSLSASNSEATWVLTSYLVANAVVLPASNWFSHYFGRKRFLLTCVTIFTVASFFCGAAPAMWVILLARICQGAGGGALQPLSQSILLESFPVEERSGAMAAYGVGVVLAPVIGPTLGGWLTDTFSWRYAFYINIPVGILAIVMLSRFLHDPPFIKNAQVSKFDGMGFGLLCVWTGCLQIVLDKGQEDDWFSAPWICWMTATMLAALFWWIWRSWRNREGLVDLHVLKDRNFGVGCLLIALLGVCIYVVIAFLPLYYQELMGYTAFWAGLVVGPRGIGALVGSVLTGVIGSKIDGRKLMMGGFLGFAVCSYIFSLINLNFGPYTLLIPILATGFALVMCFIPLVTIMMSTIPRKEIGNATGLSNMVRNIGGSVGIAIATTALVRRAALHQSEIGAHLAPSNPLLQEKVRMIAAYLGPHVGVANARGGALGSIYGLLVQQAALAAYVDLFRWMAVASLLCAALVWLFKKPGKQVAPPPGVH